MRIAQTWGGAIDVFTSHVELHNTHFVRNKAIRNGGAVSINLNSTVNATFATFTGNGITNTNTGAVRRPAPLAPPPDASLTRASPPGR